MTAAQASPLRTLQRQFAAVMRGRGPQPSPLLPTARMRIYRTAYRVRLLEVLAMDYPAVRAALGEHRFERLGRAYLAACPSRHPNLNRFGVRFVRFLARQPVRRRAELLGLARLDLAWTQAFDALEPTPRPVAPAAVDWSRQRLPWHPSVRLLRVPATVVDRWQALRTGQPLPRPRTGRAEVCVRRRGGEVVWQELPSAAAALLRRLQRRLPLPAALAPLPAGAPLQAWFAAWRDGMFALPCPTDGPAAAAGQRRIGELARMPWLEFQ
ncbi:MAG: DNA-binding domain-containing protein [Planctomycetes bacterium]|nr:DNA-binding domain-containing protein [Planctomycetota bacterium]